MRLILQVLLLLSCATTPTGRNQLRLVDQDKMASLGDDSYAKMKQQLPQSKNPQEIRYVQCITDRILRAMGENPNNWEVTVFKDHSANAFALPGKNMGVHTGMLKIAENQDQLAAVIGHEIAHVTANHGNERVSQNMLIAGGLSIASLVIGESTENDQLIMAGLGLGAQVGIALPFSRSHETEADMLGQEYMAKAGFDPRAAVDLWQNMQKKAGNAPPEFLSTHPATKNRIENLRDNIPNVFGHYKNQKNRPNCR